MLRGIFFARNKFIDWLQTAAAFPDATRTLPTTLAYAQTKTGTSRGGFGINHFFLKTVGNLYTLTQADCQQS